jgi:hypothetical protein
MNSATISRVGMPAGKLAISAGLNQSHCEISLHGSADASRAVVDWFRDAAPAYALGGIGSRPEGRKWQRCLADAWSVHGNVVHKKELNGSRVGPVIRLERSGTD